MSAARLMRCFSASHALLACVLVACSESTGPTNGAAPGAARLEVVASGLDTPVFLTAPAGDPRLFVVEQSGRIRIIENDALFAAPFLDITARVGSGGERGLLGLAFHPDHAANGLFYVNYTDRSGRTRVERYEVSSDPSAADPSSARDILTVDQPFANHNGGMIAFGPDGMLYIGLGDGGSGGDPLGHGQNRATLLGGLLRIDVDGAEPYAIPPDNPFTVDPTARPEIWAWGLRNPWRFSFDPLGDHLFIADVGQNAVEEVNAVVASAAGLNYGWNIMEGGRCFGAVTCDQTGLTLPVLEYAHVPGCNSVTGGYVYRGSAIPALRGHYFYADYCAGWVRSFRLDGAAVVDEQEWPFGDIGRIPSFGADSAGELYVLGIGAVGGTVYRIVPGA